MSGYENFAVAGAGNIGAYIAEDLLKLKANGSIKSVVVLTRSNSGHPPVLVEKGAKFETVDYSSPESLEKALKGIDVVISTLGGFALSAQDPLAEAAKKASVKLFVPSEFGSRTDGRKEPFFAAKTQFRLKLKELGLPYAAFFTGLFPDFVLLRFAGTDLPGGKVTVNGVGDALISWTSRADISRYVAHVLTALPKEKLEWRLFSIEGDRKSYNQIISEYEKKTNKKLEVTRRSREELEAVLKANPADIVTFILLDLDLGGGLNGKVEDLDNHEFPGWNPVGAVDAAIEAAQK